jgi:hypothetical protein
MSVFQSHDPGNANLTNNRPITIPRIAPEGTTYGASNDLNPPFGEENHQSECKAIKQPYKAPCYHVLEPVKDKPVKRAAGIPFKIAATNISVLKGSSREKKIPTPSSAPTASPMTKATVTFILPSPRLLPDYFPEFNVA